MQTPDQIAEMMEETIRDMDEKRHKLVQALMLLKPTANVIQMPLRRGPRPKGEGNGRRRRDSEAA